MLQAKLHLALASSLLFLASAHALEVKLNSTADLKQDFLNRTGIDALSVSKNVIQFQSADKLTLARIALAERGRVLGSADATVTVQFRFKSPESSFGILTGVQGEEKDAYLTLVNIGEKEQGVLRMFKVSPKGQAYEGNVLKFQGIKTLPRGDWFTLKVTTASKGKAVEVTAEVAPEKGGGAPVTASFTDEAGIQGPGEIQLRFFAGEPGREIEAREFRVTPDPKPIK